MDSVLACRLANAERLTTASLLAELGPEGHWVGQLSGSALSTATAVTALAAMDSVAHASLIQGGLSWLAGNVNSDGGWGDTVRSQSNLSTTALVWAAFGAAKADLDFPVLIRGAEDYLRREAGALDRLVEAIEACYGEDRTFSIPITMMLALSGRLGPDGWRRVRALPFELAALPRALFGALRLPVVSYALPALIAIGQVVHTRSGRFHPLRDLVRGRTLEILHKIQPSNGGFLEAVPLTSFVTMSLATMGQSEHIVGRRGVEFLRKSVRSDGCWPIDTNLATWVTTLSIKALRHQPGSLGDSQRAVLRDWLLGQQYQIAHPYTGAAPGGWAWSNLPGAVPDADDTAGALLALRELDVPQTEDRAISAGIEWLLGLQNRDGGMPTFCRGWGTLPFDRSTPELTAHALRAWRGWMPRLSPGLQNRTIAAMARAINFLKTSQRSDGSWIPLWFGNEHSPHKENPVYGTAQVLLALTDDESAILVRGREFLRANQNQDGGWGGFLGAPSSVEETSLALEALANDPASQAHLERGLKWLLNAVENDALKNPAPIGLYFARLWYFERLYPLIFATCALGACRRGLTQ